MDTCYTASESLNKKLLRHLNHVNKARIRFLASLVIAILVQRTISYEKIARGFATKSKLSSIYRNIQRFFANFSLAEETWANLIAGMALPKSSGWVITIDRTNWKFGQSNLNFLVLAVANRGVAIPLFWIPLGKRGNSNHWERILLMDKFISCFGKDVIKAVAADREFIGEKWLSYLTRNEINICIRTKENITITKRNGKTLSSASLFRFLKPGESATRQGVKTMGMTCRLSALRNESNDLVVIIHTLSPGEAFETYRQRWEIETLFSCLKTRGFNFEDTRVTNLDRLSRIFGVLAIALVWCLNTGEFLTRYKKIPVKKHQRKAKSVFRLGWEQLVFAITNLYLDSHRFRRMVKLFDISKENPEFMKLAPLRW